MFFCVSVSDSDSEFAKRERERDGGDGYSREKQERPDGCIHRQIRGLISLHSDTFWVFSVCSCVHFLGFCSWIDEFDGEFFCGFQVNLLVDEIIFSIS